MSQATAASTTAAAITLVYIRSAEAEPAELDLGLHRIVARYQPHVELCPMDLDDLPAEFAGFARRAPAVIVLRDGEIIGEAMGAAMPMRELDRVVRCAVEWPAQET